MNRYFYTTTDLNKSYDLLINAAKKNCEKKNKEILEIKKIKKNFFSIKLILFLFKTLIFLKFFNLEKIALLKYRKCSIGIHALAETFRDIRVFRSNLFLRFKLIKNLLIGGLVIDSGYNSMKKESRGIFINDLGYINGLLFSIFAKYKKIIYFVGYPRGFAFIDFNKKNNLKYNELSKLKIIIKKKSLKQKNIKNNFIKQIVKNSKKLKWMENSNYPTFVKKKKMLLKKLPQIDYVIYAHSFVDGQLWWGYDGFSNLYDWLTFTINYLLKKNKQILVKGHPNFYNKSMFNKLSLEDSEVFGKIIKKNKGYKNFNYINFPIENNFILKNLKKETVLISHHGTSLLEGSFLGFKSISSSSNFYSNDFLISNTWDNLKEYKKLLDKKSIDLSFDKKRITASLEHISNKVFGSKYNVYGKYYWQKLISNHINVKLNFKKGDNYLYSKIRDNKTKSEIINILSNNIEEVSY